MEMSDNTNKDNNNNNSNSNGNGAESSSGGKAKRVMAWIGLAIIGLWILATAAIAILPVPNKGRIFPLFMFGCIIFPIFLWIGMWIYGAVTGRKNVASFRTKEMEETLRQAEEIREKMEEKETGGKAADADNGK
ncbi:MAG: hypothetical protein K5879_08940 [Lachnospiraceae bacterium]|nr:hypothetical protein [Lachnospiraceae bacterium]